MAEYIEFYCPHGDDFEGGDECDRCEKYEFCMETPAADVIERSKIDKAIDKIKGLSVQVDKIQVLKILQECIGE